MIELLFEVFVGLALGVGIIFLIGVIIRVVHWISGGIEL